MFLALVGFRDCHGANSQALSFEDGLKKKQCNIVRVTIHVNSGGISPGLNAEGSGSCFKVIVGSVPLRCAR